MILANPSYNYVNANRKDWCGRTQRRVWVQTLASHPCLNCSIFTACAILLLTWVQGALVAGFLYVKGRENGICVGLARTVYQHRILPNVWWYPCHKYRIYTVTPLNIWFWPTLHMCASVQQSRQQAEAVHALPYASVQARLLKLPKLAQPLQKIHSRPQAKIQYVRACWLSLVLCGGGNLLNPVPQQHFSP